jgi:hypothetical protein
LDSVSGFVVIPSEAEGSAYGFPADSFLHIRSEFHIPIQLTVLPLACNMSGVFGNHQPKI